MKLLRYGPPGKEMPGLLDADGVIRDLSGEMLDLSGEALLPHSIERLRRLEIDALPEVEGDPRIGPCVGHVGKFLCTGINYADHAAAIGVEVLPEPILFMKATSAIAGPYDDIVLPRGSTKTDWEIELGVVIGRHGKHIAESEALAHIAGYCIVNDLSERDFQLEHGGQWVKGKSCDGFGPIGPWLVTADEVPDPQNLNLWLEVDGKRYQDGNTRTMIFTVAQLISYTSQFMTLHPGDIISTGTPPGVGLGLKPPVYLKPENVIRAGVQGLGEQRQRVVASR